MKKEDRDDPDSQLAMVLFRYSDWRERPAPRKVLERMADAANVPRPLLDPILRVIHSFRLAAEGRFHEGKALEEVLVSRLTAIVRMSVEVALESALAEDAPPFLTWPPRAEDREDGEELWLSLEPYTTTQRAALAEEVEELWSWALCERVAAKSAAVAGPDPAQALELAELACRIAERVPGPETWSLRLQGYAWAHVSNALSVRRDLTGAEEALRHARELWDAGAPGDPGLLDESFLARAESTLQRAQAAIRPPGT
jgi:hypothetical protein